MTEKMKSNIDVEVNDLDTAKDMFSRVIKGYYKDKITLETAYKIGCYLIDKYGEEVIKELK